MKRRAMFAPDVAAPDQVALAAAFAVLERLDKCPDRCLICLFRCLNRGLAHDVRDHPELLQRR